MTKFNFFILIHDIRDVDRAMTVLQDQVPNINIDRNKKLILDSRNVQEKLAGLRLPISIPLFAFDKADVLSEIEERFGDFEFDSLFHPTQITLSIFKPRAVKYGKLIEM